MSKHKPGDVVTIRSWKSMKNEYGINILGNINKSPYFINEMSYMCEKSISLGSISRPGGWYDYDGFSLADWMFVE